jgi:class 3 adenylate cyclase
VRDLQRIASRAASLPLLILQNTAPEALATCPTANRAFAANACRLGLNVLLCGSDRESDNELEFLRVVYSKLARGGTLGESVRAARTELRQRSSVAEVARLQAELYGEGGLVVFVKDKAPRGEDNLRQVTIMSFDLVGSTRLLATLGAERYSEDLTEYHKRCAEIVAGHGGAPDDPQGDDGIMCYFGFRLRARTQPSGPYVPDWRSSMLFAGSAGVRIGISTGQVVVRDGQPVGAAIPLPRGCNRSQSREHWSSANPRAASSSSASPRAARGVPLLKGFDQPEQLFRLLAWRGPMI